MRQKMQRALVIFTCLKYGHLRKQASTEKGVMGETLSHENAKGGIVAEALSRCCCSYVLHTQTHTCKYMRMQTLVTCKQTGQA